MIAARVTALPSIALAVACALIQAASEPAPPPRGLSERELRIALSLSPLPEPPADPSNRFADDPRAARLGHRFFFDPRLSANGAIACASCHDPARDLTDGKPLAEGLGTAARRAPSLWNVAWSEHFFWDGRADTLWSQALQPIENELEMGGDRLAVAHLVAEDARLRGEYEALFGALPALDDATRFPAHAKPMGEASADPRDRAWRAMRAEDRAAVDRVFANVAKALEAFERGLVRDDAPFDRFVAGLRGGDEAQLGALSDSALRGFQLFVGKARCRTCHVGPSFSDGEFHDLGLPTSDGGLPSDPGRYRGIELALDDPFSSAGEQADAGREEAARRRAALALAPERWGEFKTPSLRALAREGPYMHAGQFADLDAVLRFYSTREGAVVPHGHRELVLQPLELSDAELRDLAAFLRSLRGEPRHPELLEPIEPVAAR